MRKFKEALLVVLSFVVVGLYGGPVNAAGICGVPRIDCDTGHVEPASKIVIPETQLTFTDVTTNNLSTAKHGFCPKATNSATDCLLGTGVFGTCPGGSSGPVPTGTGWRHVTSGVEDAVASTPTATQVGADPTGSASSAQSAAESYADGIVSTHAGLTTTAHGGIVSSTDTRLTDSRAPTGDITSAGAVKLYQGTGTSTYTSVALSSTPRVEVSGVTEAMQTLADNTTGNVSASAHGYAPKAPNDATKYLDGTGAWSAPTGGGGSFTTAYSVDFTGLSAQNLLTGGDGNKTIDGKTWALINSANLTTAYLNDGTHSGLYLRCNTNNSSNYGTTLTGGALYATFGAFSSALNGNQLGTYTEVWLWYMFSTPHVPNAGTEAINLGTLSLFSSYTTAGMTSFHAQNIYSGALYYGQGQTMYNGISASAFGQTSTAQDVFAFKITTNAVEAFAGASVGGAFPAKTALNTAGRISMLPPSTLTGGLPVANPGMRAWLSVVSGNTAGNADLLVKKMFLEYR
jgi:hypothetical protein